MMLYKTFRISNTAHLALPSTSNVIENTKTSLLSSKLSNGVFKHVELRNTMHMRVASKFYAQASQLSINTVLQF